MKKYTQKIELEGVSEKVDLFVFVPIVKKITEPKITYICNTLEIYIPFWETHFCTGKTIHNLLYSLFWAL